MSTLFEGRAANCGKAAKMYTKYWCGTFDKTLTSSLPVNFMVIDGARICTEISQRTLYFGP